MAAFKHIICATDFSLSSECALRYARALAKQDGARLTLAHVVDGSLLRGWTPVQIGGSRESLMKMEAAVLDHAEAKMVHEVRSVGETGSRVESSVLMGAPAEGLVDLAAHRGADLIVVGTRGHSGLERFILGSVCEKIVRWSPVPVLSVRRARDYSGNLTDDVKIRRVLCPVDFSGFSRLAVPMAANLCRRFGAVLELMHVVHPITNFTHEFTTVTGGTQREGRSALESLERLAENYGDVDPELSVLSGTPSDVLAKSAERDDIDLIVMATHGRSGVAHALLGSVTEKLVRTAPCPVLTIRPAESVKDERLERFRLRRPAEARSY